MDACVVYGSKGLRVDFDFVDAEDGTTRCQDCQRQTDVWVDVCVEEIVESASGRIMNYRGRHLEKIREKILQDLKEEGIGLPICEQCFSGHLTY